MSFKSETTKQIKQELKAKKGNTEMKTSNKKTVIVTAVITLVIVAALVAQALYFYSLGTKNQQAYNDQVKTEAVSLQKAVSLKQ